MSTKIELLTSYPYAVQVLQGDNDITQLAGVRSIQYHSDGQVTQIRIDGSQRAGHWELIEQESIIRMTMEQSGVSDWAILELNEHIFRKRDIARGLLAVQTPCVPVVSA